MLSLASSVGEKHWSSGLPMRSHTMPHPGRMDLEPGSTPKGGCRNNITARCVVCKGSR